MKSDNRDHARSSPSAVKDGEEQASHKSFHFCLLFPDASFGVYLVFLKNIRDAEVILFLVSAYVVIVWYLSFFNKCCELYVSL
jgi:hypothetical protein